MLALLKEISLRHLLGAKLRSLLVVVGIALGVAMLVATQATSGSMMASFEDLVHRVSGGADFMVVGNTTGVDSSLVGAVSEVPGVAHAAAALEVTSEIAGGGQPLLILGVDFLGDTHFLPFEPAKGQESVVEDPLAFANDPTAILITQKLAKRLQLQKGSELRLLTAEGMRPFHVWAVLDDSGPAASFGGQVAVMFLDAAQVTFARGTLVDRIDVALATGADANATLARLQKLVGHGARVERPAQVGERLRALSAPLRDGLRLSGLVALLVAMFIIYNAIGVSVTQRRKEVGILRSLGVLRSSIIWHFCLEAMLLSLPGSLLGLGIARLLVDHTQAQTMEAINRIYVTAPTAARILPLHMLEGVLAGFVIACASAYLPARRGAAMDPVQALRASAILGAATSVRFRLFGAVGLCVMAMAWPPAVLGWPFAGSLATLFNMGGAALCAPALVVLLRRALIVPVSALLGVPGRLGLDYVERNLARSSVNVLALMIAVSMSVSVGGWLFSFERSVRAWFEQVTAADLTITAGSPFLDRRHVALAPSALTRLGTMPGVAELQPLRTIEQRVDSTSFRLVASDTRSYLRRAVSKHKPWHVLDGKTPVTENELFDTQSIVLSENAAHRLHKRAGEALLLETPTGSQSFLVRAIVVDYSSEQGAGYIDRRYFLPMWKDEALDAINVYLAENVDPNRVADQVRQKLGGGEALFVTKTTELRDQFMGLVDRSFSYTRSLELVVLLIALMGVVGTMISAILDRVREIGTLRALGTTRRQLALALVVEAAFLGLCAVIGGLVSGTVQSLLFLDAIAVRESGWHLDYVFPLVSNLRIALLVVLTAGLSGLAPGLRAARMEVKDALSYE